MTEIDRDKLLLKIYEEKQQIKNCQMLTKWFEYYKIDIKYVILILNVKVGD